MNKGNLTNKDAIIVTGAAGFIGSNLCNALLKDGYEVIGIDNLSTGRYENIKSLDPDSFVFINLDLFDGWKKCIELKDKFKKITKLFHLAANADVRGGETNSLIDFNQNITVTHNICELSKILGVEHLLFASTAAVYGDPPEDHIPTKETYHPLQTSHYGASKIAAESIIESYSAYKYFKTSSFRFVSWIGPNYSHGVIYDFVKKLINNNKSMEILGNGEQTKSYLHVFDGINAMLSVMHNQKEYHSTFNVGHTELINVLDLADLVCAEMNLKNVEYKLTSNEPRGWIGDSPKVLLNTEKLNSFGWNPKITIIDGIKDTVRFLLKDNQNLFR